jgi:hypothetical protein
MVLGCPAGVSLARGVAEATWALAGGLAFTGAAVAGCRLGLAGLHRGSLLGDGFIVIVRFTDSR